MKRSHDMTQVRVTVLRGSRSVAAAALVAALLMAGSQLQAKAPSSGEEALTWIMTKMDERRYRHNKRKTVIMDALISQMESAPEIWSREHPSHRTRLDHFKQNLRCARGSDTIAFGDSLLDMTRKDLRSVPECLNFAVSGAWAHHMARMAADIRPELERAGLYRSVRYVVIGSLGGNPFLMRQPVNVTIQQSVAALESVRKLYPAARIIVYGIPPTMSLYVNTNAMAFEAALYQWVQGDRDAVILPLQRRFAGRLGLFPREGMTVDGIHFSHLGTLEFDRLIERAKHAPLKSIVD